MDRVAKWISKHPLQAAARVVVAKALREGVLIRPKVCGECGERTALIGHHANYAKPLDVTWMCYWCRFCERQRLLGKSIPRQRHRVPSPRLQKPTPR